jgi:two-component system, OmpR family, sensor histidine kinase MtrB
MSRLLRSWRTSILVRVSAITIALSTLLIFVVGTLLSTQISSGVYREKMTASISEADSLVNYSQGQLDATTYRSDLKLSAVIDTIFHVDDVNANVIQREVILLPTPTTAKKSTRYQGSSNFLDFSIIDAKFREQVRKHATVQSKYITIKYLAGLKVDGIVVGSTITIPNNNIYEIYYLFPLTQQSQLMGLIDALLWISGAVLIFLIALITWYVTGRIVLPVREAAEIAEELTAGDLGRRLAVRGEDELGRLAVAFNEMAVSLQQQISRLENLSRLQQRFVSDVSHELRTPLTTIRMASQVLFDARHNLDPASARSAELLIAQIERFETLLTDLLEVSRFDARAAILEMHEVDISNLVRQVADQLHAPGDLRIEAPDTSVTAQVDPRRIERILRNLISNAIDHSEGKGVVIKVAQSEHEVAVGVRDYGIGFSEREGERLFDRFWRADPSRSRLRGGTGLGLAIALEDAQLHEGTLKAWGRPNLGAHFVMTLPKSPGIPLSSEPIDVYPEDAPSTALFELDTDDI